MTPKRKLEGAEARQIDYAFDSRGLYVARNFLSRSMLKAARIGLSQLTFAREPWARGQYRVSSIHTTAEVFRELHRAIERHAITARLIGYPPRLLESYALNRKSGRLPLHGGAAEYLTGSEVRDISAASWVLSGRMYSLRVKVLIYLDDVQEKADGCFAYVEGSHKAAYSFHRSFPRGRATARDLMRTVTFKAGDGVWLNEALLHGAESKTSKRDRRLLAYTFGPTFMSDWCELSRGDSSKSGYHRAETEKSPSE